KQRSVADVKSLRSELQFEGFSNLEVLKNRNVDALIRRHIEYVMSFVSGSAERLPAELTDIEPLINALSACLSRDKTRPILRDADGILLGGSVQYCERLACAVRIDSVNLPALDDLPRGALQRPAERQFIIRRKCDAVFDHVVARTIVPPEIIQYLSTTHTGASGTANVRKRTGECVIGCDRQPRMVAALEGRLKRVVIADAVGPQQLNRVHKRNLSIVWLARAGERHNRGYATAATSKRRQVGIHVRNGSAEMAYRFS